MLNLLKPLLNVTLKIPSSPLHQTFLRGFASKNDPCSPKLILMKPDCKTAVITGGTEGIGFATAHQLLCDKAEKVALIGTDTKKGVDAVNNLNCSFGSNKAVFFKCDVKCKEDVENTMKNIQSDLHQIDIVINSAAIWDDANWMEEMHVNLAGTVNVNLSAKDHIEKGNGLIINISGTHGLEPFSPSPLFAAFESAIIHFSRSFGHDINYRKHGVRVVTLCTGITKTELLIDVEKRMLCKHMGKDMDHYLKNACCQKADVCAKAAIEVIKYGPPGSVWIVEGSRLFYFDAPHYKNHINLISQFV